jgi:hypothetical protein
VCDGFGDVCDGFGDGCDAFGDVRDAFGDVCDGFDSGETKEKILVGSKVDFEPGKMLSREKWRNSINTTYAPCCRQGSLLWAKPSGFYK